MSGVAPASSWENMASSFRNIEGKAHSQLSEFNQFAVAAQRAASSSLSSPGGTATSSDGGPGAGRAARVGGLDPALLPAASDCSAWEAQLERRDADVTAMLRQMASLLGPLGAAAASAVEGSGGSSGALSARQRQFLTRFRTVHEELSAEHRKSRDTARSALARMRLFADYAAESDAEVGGVSGGGASDAKLLAGERASIQSSLAGVNEAIGTGENSYASLLRQKDIFEGVRQRLGDLAARLPAIDGVIDRIRRHEQRDSIVLAIVVALCMFIGFVYVMNKQ